MKRTQNINQETFRKSWRSYRLAPVALAISAVFMLAGCEKPMKPSLCTKMLMIAQRQIRPRAQNVPLLTTRLCRKQLKLRPSMQLVKIAWLNSVNHSVLKLLHKQVWYQHLRHLLKQLPLHHSKAVACGCH